MSKIQVINGTLFFNRNFFRSEYLSLQNLSGDFDVIHFGPDVEEIDIEYLLTIINQGCVCCVKISPEIKIDVDKGNKEFISIDGSLMDKEGNLYFTPREKRDTYRIPEGAVDITEWQDYVGKRKIKHLILPSTVCKIDTYYLKDFKSLESVDVAEGNQLFTSDCGWLFKSGKTEFMGKKNGRIIFPDSLPIEKEFLAILYASNPKMRITVSENNRNYTCKNGVTFDKKGNLLFVDYDQKNLVIPDGVKRIHPFVTFTAIKDLESLYIPYSLEYVDLSMFGSIHNISVSEKNHALKHEGNVLYKTNGKLVCIADFDQDGIDIPEGVTDVGDLYSAFHSDGYDRLKRISFPQSIDEGFWDLIMERAYENNTRLEFPPDIRYVVDYEAHDSFVKISSERAQIFDRYLEKPVGIAGSKSADSMYALVCRKVFYQEESPMNLKDCRTVALFPNIREASDYLRENMESLIEVEYEKTLEELGIKEKKRAPKKDGSEKYTLGVYTGTDICFRVSFHIQETRIYETKETAEREFFSAEQYEYYKNNQVPF